MSDVTDVRNLLCDVIDFGLSTDIIESHEVMRAWIEAVGLVAAADIGLHLSDHNCKNSAKTLAAILNDIERRVLFWVADYCKNFNLENPFEVAVSGHNQKVVDEILKESQNG